MMADLVDREAQKKEYLKHDFFPAIISRILKNAPAVDAVEVVRCKDCKHRENYPALKDVFCRAWMDYNSIGEDGYCNYGERRDK